MQYICNEIEPTIYEDKSTTTILQYVKGKTYK